MSDEHEVMPPCGRMVRSATSGIILGFCALPENHPRGARGPGCTHLIGPIKKHNLRNTPTRSKQ